MERDLERREEEWRERKSRQRGERERPRRSKRKRNSLMLLDLLESMPSMIENRTSIIRIRPRNELDSSKSVIVNGLVVVEFRTSLFELTRRRKRSERKSAFSPRGARSIY